MAARVPISEEFWKDQEWAFGHYPELMASYGDMWVAIVNREVVSYGKALSKVEEEAARKTGKDREEIAVLYVESGTQIF